MPTSTQVMTLYLREVGSYPRLNQEEERELVLCVAHGRAARRKLRQTAPPSTKRSKALQNLVARGKAAQRRLIESNLRLVVYWARRHNPYDLPLEDLVQEGNVGLMASIRRFDPQKGVRLSTCAQWWIRKALYKACIDRDGIVVISRKPLKKPYAETRREHTEYSRESLRVSLCRPCQLCVQYRGFFSRPSVRGAVKTS